MRFLIATFLILAVAGVSTQASAQCTGNNCTSLVLHAIDTSFQSCDVSPMDCSEGNRPVVDVTGFSALVVAVLVRNYETITGVQVAFDWGSWIYTFSLWDCQGNQLSAVTPSGAGGATDGTIATAFDVISGGMLTTIGRMNFATAPASGCMELVESSFPFGNHVVDAGNQDEPVTPINALNWGKVCVGTGGYDSCDAVVAVEATTWGQIKQQFAR